MLKTSFRALAAATAFLLTGCWTSPPFHTAADAVPALPDGRYRITEKGRPSQELTVKVLPTGMTQIDPELEVGFVPVNAGRRRYLAWFGEVGRSADDAVLYWLLEPVTAREFIVYLLTCKGDRIEVLQRASHESRSCSISDRGSLEQAVSRVTVPQGAEAGRVTKLD